MIDSVKKMERVTTIIVKDLELLALPLKMKKLMKKYHPRTVSLEERYLTLKL